MVVDGDERRVMSVNVGVIGCGYWGPKHIRNYHEIAEANLAAVCDVDERKLRQVRDQYPYVKTTSDINEFFNNAVDAVVIATPADTHFWLAREALLHNKHVMLEKPMTPTGREATELVHLAEQRNLVLMVGHTYIYHPAVDFLRNLVASGELGQIYSIDAERLNLGLFRRDVDVVWDLAPHDVSILSWVLDEMPFEVSARGTHHVDPNRHDAAYIELRFASGVLGHVHVSWLHPRKVREITIVGSKKMAVYDDVSETEKIRIYDKGLSMPSNGSNGNGHDRFSGWPPNYRYGDVVIPFISNTEPLKLEATDFVRSIKEGKRPKCDGWAGLGVVGILEAASRSLANGGQRENLQSIGHLTGAATVMAGREVLP